MDQPTPSMVFNGKALKHWRAVRNQPQTKLATAAGLRSQGHLSQLESGDKQPSWLVVVAIADALGISPVCLVAPGCPVNAETWPYEKGKRTDLIAVSEQVA